MYKICKQHKIYNIRNILHLLILPRCKLQGKERLGLVKRLGLFTLVLWKERPRLGLVSCKLMCACQIAVTSQ